MAIGIELVMFVICCQCSWIYKQFSGTVGKSQNSGNMMHRFCSDLCSFPEARSKLMSIKNTEIGEFLTPWDLNGCFRDG